MPKYWKIGDRNIKLRGAIRKLDIDRVNIAERNARTPGFNIKFAKRSHRPALTAMLQEFVAYNEKNLPPQLSGNKQSDELQTT